MRQRKYLAEQCSGIIRWIILQEQAGSLFICFIWMPPSSGCWSYIMLSLLLTIPQPWLLPALCCDPSVQFCWEIWDREKARLHLPNPRWAQTQSPPQSQSEISLKCSYPYSCPYLSPGLVLTLRIIFDVGGNVPFIKSRIFSIYKNFFWGFSFKHQSYLD